MIDVISKRKIYLSVSLILVTVSWISIIVFGFKLGIDLQGGTEWRLVFDKPVNLEGVFPEAWIKKSGKEILLRLPPLDEETHQRYLQILREKFGEFTEESFSSIGPTVGSELRQRALWAIILVLGGISLYVAFAFRKASREIKSWKYGFITLLTLFHDVSIPAGLLAFLGWWRGVEIDTNFIVAILVIMGFSVHDTIVVFDRIRENLMINRQRRIVLKDIINYSVNETLARSINTSLTLVLILLALIFWGPSSLFYFILTILVGTVVGTYSSIFVATPLLYIWQPRDLQK